MSHPNPQIILPQIENYALWAQELATQNDLCGLLMNWQKRAAFERVLAVLGQNIKRLPADLCQNYPAVSWQKWVNWSDHITATHDGLDYASLWRSANQETPGLITTVRQILADLKAKPPA